MLIRVRVRGVLATIFLSFSLLLVSGSMRAQQGEAPDVPGIDHANMSLGGRPKTAERLLADKKESEFNHHLAGLLVILAGVFILVQDRLAKHWPLAPFVWPMCFLAAGLFLLVFSDTEIWPFGPQTPWYAITHNPEDLQHKLFAIILLVLGFVELQRTKGGFNAPWMTWIFPVVAGTGAVLLLFHIHSGDMQAPNAMETMEHIQQQHRLFASTGLGVALTSFLAETPQESRKIFKNIWPALLVVLGILLMVYTE